MENYQNLFFPKNSRVPKEELIGMASETQKYLGRLFENEVVNNHGKLFFSKRTLNTFGRVGKVISGIVKNSDEVRIPEVKVERLTLSKLLVDSLVGFNGDIEVVCPVCPDYGSGDEFYRTLGEHLSPEALAGVNASKIISERFRQFGFKPRIKIIVADTEDDLPEIIKNCANANVDFYRNQCEQSVRRISENLKGNDDIKVLTFTDLYGTEFRNTQYKFEEIIRKTLIGDGSFTEIVAKIGSERVLRHSQILGRREVNFELTVRYMAQYAALGHISRKSYPTILMNYQTPNRRFYNAAMNINKSLILDQGDFQIVPVIGTIARRNNI